MNARNTAPTAVRGPDLKAVPESGRTGNASTTLDGQEPPLIRRRAGQPAPGQDYAPVIRLEPRRHRAEDHSVENDNRAHAEVIDIDAAEEKRRVTAISKSLGQAAVEVLAGTRPISQLSRWLDPRSYERLQLRSTMVREQRESRHPRSSAGTRRPHRNPQVRTARLCRLSNEVYEASLVVVEHKRARAVALRLEYRKDLWKVTALEIG